MIVSCRDSRDVAGDLTISLKSKLTFRLTISVNSEPQCGHVKLP
jgi:hypothetical protein